MSVSRFVINLPDVGEGIAEAELTEWEVAVGDVVEEDDILGSVMTDKASVEVPSSVSGKVVWLCGEPGDMIAIGSKYVEIEVASESARGEPTCGAPGKTITELDQSDQSDTTEAEAAAHSETLTVILPDVGEGIAEAEIAEWLVSVGDIVEEEDTLGAVMTDKATVEVPSVHSGKVVWLAGEIGDKIAIGSPFVRLEVTTESAGKATKEPEVAPRTPALQPAKQPKQTGKEHAPGSKPLASPSVRQSARDQGVSLLDVRGTGPGGRIEHQDLSDHISRSRLSKPSRSRDAETKQVKIVGIRRQIAQKMVLSKTRIPHITIVEEVDVTDLESLRKKLNRSFAEERGKLTLLPFIASAISMGIREHPEMNATYDDEKGIVTQHANVHIGMAAQTPAGLTVPVIKHADSNSLWETASEISRLSQAVRSGKASVSDLTGATITISSLGALGAFATTPIINHPEVAIIGVNKVSIRPMWNGQSFEPRQMMNLSSSFDHRVIDGWDAALFVKKLKDLLETPALLFVEA